MATVEAIKSFYLEADTASVTFSSIPDTYQHLKLVQSWRGAYVATGIGMKMRFGDSGGLDTSAGDYSKAMIYTGGTSVGSLAVNNETSFDFWGLVGDYPDRYEYTTFNVDIMDYTNTSKYTHVRCFNNAQHHTSGAGYYMAYLWGNWRTTNVLTTIEMQAYGDDIFRGSEFTLYGWKDS